MYSEFDDHVEFVVGVVGDGGPSLEDFAHENLIFLVIHHLII